MKLTVLGAGCWGLTLAWLLTDNFDNVTVWGRESDIPEDLRKNKHTSKPLEVQLKEKVVAGIIPCRNNNGISVLFCKEIDKA